MPTSCSVCKAHLLYNNCKKGAGGIASGPFFCHIYRQALAFSFFRHCTKCTTMHTMNTMLR